VSWYNKLSFWKGTGDLVIYIFLFGIALDMITPSFYNVMKIALLPGLVATIVFLIKSVRGIR